MERNSYSVYLGPFKESKFDTCLGERNNAYIIFISYTLSLKNNFF